MLLFASSFALAQIPTDDITRYLFSNGNLINEANSGVGDLVQSGTASTTTNGIEGIPNNALKINSDSFDGSAVVTSSTTTEFSYSFWFKLSGNATSEQEIIRFTNQDGHRIFFNQQTFSNGAVDFKWRIEDSSGSGTGRLATESSLNDGNWHHIVMTSTAVTNPTNFMELRIYLDGVFSQNLTNSSGPFTNGNIFYSSHATTISNQTSTGFTNDIDNVRVYDRTLTQTEITALANEIVNAMNPTDDLITYSFENGSYLNYANASNNLSLDSGATNTVNGHCGESNNALQSAGGTRLKASGINGSTEETSYSFFVNTTATGNFSEIVHHFSNYNNTSIFSGSTAVLDGNKITVVMRPFCGTGLCAQQSGYLNTIGSTVVNDGNWHHIAYTVAKNTIGSDIQYEIKLYIDGILDATNTTGLIPASNNPAYINGTNEIRLFSGSGDFYVGSLDDVRIFNRVLSQPEIVQMSSYCIPLSPSIVYVDAGATGANNGNTWADAYTSLTTALSNNPSTGPTKEFWVKAGTYTLTSLNDKFIISENQKVYGGFNGTETMLSQRDSDANETILSGDVNSNDNGILQFNETTYADNAYNVVSVVGSNILLDGLTIKGGNATGFGSNPSIRSGAAIIISQNAKNADFNRLLIDGNKVIDGGVVYFNQSSGQTGNYNYNFTNCIFRNNLGRFAAVYYASNPRTSGTAKTVFVNCVFYDNIVANVPGYNQGTNTLFWFRTDVSTTHIGEFINCTVSSNDFNASNYTASIISASRINGNCTVRLYNSILWDNKRADNNAEHSTIGSFGSQAVATRVVRNSIAPNFSSGIAQNSSTSNPMLGSFPGKYKYQIGNSSSFAIDFGDNSFFPASVTSDLLGNLRIFGSQIDAGAYEYNSTLSNETFTVNENVVKIYPNPTSNILNILTDKELESVEVYDVLGALVLSEKTNKINVSGLASGAYIIKIKTKFNQLITKRFIKQ